MGGPVNDAPGLIANINATSGAGTHWFAAGDFNLNPGVWPAGTPIAGVICDHPHVPVTHPGSGTNLDYAVKNPAPLINGQVMDAFVVSDHYPVAYQV
ncbi:MAG: hypothetical protein HYR94_28700 [Chloroflexi bacterium]|nr:hypothetical protein [Chloroflexota bacterium]